MIYIPGLEKNLKLVRTVSVDFLVASSFIADEFEEKKQMAGRDVGNKGFGKQR